MQYLVLDETNTYVEGVVFGPSPPSDAIIISTKEDIYKYSRYYMVEGVLTPRPESPLAVYSEETGSWSVTCPDIGTLIEVFDESSLESILQQKTTEKNQVLAFSFEDSGEYSVHVHAKLPASMSKTKIIVE